MIKVEDNRLPLGAITRESVSQQSSNAEHVGKETTRMKNRAESVPTTNSSEKISPWRKLVAIGALSTVALTGCAANNAEAQPEPTKQEQVTESPDVEETPMSPEEYRTAFENSVLRGEALTEHFLIPTGLSDEELAKTILQRFDEWENYGSNAEFNAWADNDLDEDSPSLQEKVDSVAAENAEGIVPALFAEGSRDRVKLNEFIEKRVRGNASTVGRFNQTSGDEEPFRKWRELAEVRESPAGTGIDRYLEIDYVQYANTDKNRAHELGTDEELNAEGVKQYIIVYIVSDGTSDRLFDVIPNPNFAKL